MKLKVLALGAAVASISCVTPCSAQLSIDSPASPHPESRLAFQNQDGGLDIFGQAPAAAEASPSDDYFAPGGPGEGLGAPRSILADQPSIFTSAPQSAPQSAPSSAVPSSPPSMLPAAPPVVGAGVPQGPAPLGVLANTPEAGMVPVCWPDGVGGCRTPNPIADMMARNWCTDGLWATYPGQRACQCVHIQQHTGGYNRYTSGPAACGTCGNAYAAHAWPAPPAASFVKSEATAPVSAPEAPPKPAAQLVISPVMSAPVQLPTAQTASPVQAAPIQAVPAQAPQPAAESLQPASNLLPAAPLPADLPKVPVVASRPTGFFR